MDELLEGSINEEERGGYNSEEWHKEKELWKERLGEAERRIEDGKMGVAEAKDPLPVEKGIITDKNDSSPASTGEKGKDYGSEARGD